MKIKYFGHSAFMVDDILIDPFISNNPKATAKPEDIRCKYICITHDHSDHIGDSIAIAKHNDATIITIHELAIALAKQGLKTIGMNLGGTLDIDSHIIRMVKADHSSNLGVPTGFIIKNKKDKKTIYHAGDTALFLDMKLLSRHEIDFAMLPIGGRYTMDIADAKTAAEFIKCKNVIPMHYATWDIIKTDIEQFKEDLEIEQIHVEVMHPNDEIEI